MCSQETIDAHHCNFIKKEIHKRQEKFELFFSKKKRYARSNNIRIPKWMNQLIFNTLYFGNIFHVYTLELLIKVSSVNMQTPWSMSCFGAIRSFWILAPIPLIRYSQLMHALFRPGGVVYAFIIHAGWSMDVGGARSVSVSRDKYTRLVPKCCHRRVRDVGKFGNFLWRKPYITEVYFPRAAKKFVDF